MTAEADRLDLSRPVLLAGAQLHRAQAAVVMLHGRGASAQDILSNVPAFSQPNLAYLAPEAPDHTWYPYPFLSPLEDNEPFLSSSLGLVGEIVSHLAQMGFSSRRIVLFGFSQGACLALEYAVRHAMTYGAVIGLSGGLIGPDDLRRDDRGEFGGCPVFLGCSDVDPHIPKHRVDHAAQVFRRLGAVVNHRFYPGMGHTINEDELDNVRSLLSALNAS